MHICMDWNSVNFDWNRARAFLVTAEEGSLSAAARALGLAQPTLGRQVSALEEELGIALFERDARGLSLTPGGLELVEHVRAMGDAATKVSLSASGQSQSIEGWVRLTASEAYSTFILPPIIARLRAEHPGIMIDVVATNAVTDLRRREADIAVRNADPTDPDLVARKIGVEEAHIYGAEAYLVRCGELRTAQNLANVQFVGFEENQTFLDGLNALNLNLSAKQFVVASNSHIVHWNMVKEGMGLGVMSSRIGDREPLVRRALPWLKPFEFPIWLVAHREVRSNRRVRLVFDRLADELGTHLGRVPKHSGHLR